MSLLDTNLEINEAAPKKRELNGLLLAAYLLISFGMNYMPEIYDDMYRDLGDSANTLLPILNLVILVGGAFACDALRQTRLLTIVGISLLLLLNLVAYFSDGLSGYPLAILFYAGLSFSSLPLLKRLISNTEFFGRAQKIVLLSALGIRLFSSFFFQLSFYLRMGNPDGQVIIGVLFMAIGLVLLLVDREEDQDLGTFSTYFHHHPNFWTGFILPLTLTYLVMHWTSTQSNRLFYSAGYASVDEDMQPVVSFAAMALTIGLALWLVLTHTRNHWIYIATGGGILLLLLLVYLSGFDGQSKYIWVFGLLNTIGRTIGFLGISIWIYRHSAFPFLAVLLTANLVTDEIVALISHYLELNIYTPLYPG